ncbi:retrotransposon protein, putative, ty1-copia subclass, partial [Tanacetum coccineum]
MTTKHFPHQTDRATDLLGLIHTDVCGPLRHVSRQGSSYFITFTDDFSCCGYVYLLKHKHEVFEIFKVFKNEVENQLGETIKAIQSDREGDYISQDFKDYLKACGIVQQLTPPYTPQHNDVLEWRNRTLLDMVWGCEALVKHSTLTKLQQRSIKCIFVGYPKETMGYYFYFLHENKIVAARYAEFFKNNLITKEASGKAIELEEIQEEDISPSKNTSEHHVEAECLEPRINIAPVHRSKRHIELLIDYLDAMNAEMQSMKDNQVWRLVDLPSDAKTVGSKWLFKKKTDIDGNTHTYKAHFVAKGYTQTYGINYEETFSLVADIRAIRILIA